MRQKGAKMPEYIITEHPDFSYEEPKPHKLIRCRDCKYTRSDEFLFGENYCTELGRKVREDNYCSWGTRKEVEDE